MPVDIVFLHNGKGVKLVCEGELRGKDLIEANRNLLSMPKETLPSILYAIIDETEVTSVDISTEELKRDAAQCKLMSQEDKAKTIVAVLAPSLLGFGLARMWEAFVRETNWILMSFQSKPEAESWIIQKVMETHSVILDQVF